MSGGRPWGGEGALGGARGVDFKKKKGNGDAYWWVGVPLTSKPFARPDPEEKGEVSEGGDFWRR